MAAVVGLLLALGIAGFLPLVLAAPARAAAVPLSLYASAAGWSTTSGTETNPGPFLLVYRNDQVTVTLTSDDGLLHGFFIDYNGNGVPDNGDVMSPKTTSTVQFTFFADMVGQFTYADQVIPLNTGSWSTRSNAAPTGTFHAPAAGTSWTGGKAHDISFDLTDADGDPMTYMLNYSYGGGASQPIRASTPAGSNPNIVSWTPTGFSAADTVLHLFVQDSRGASSQVDSAPFEVDSTVPTISSFTPVLGATNVDRNTLIQVNWSEPMNKATTGASNAFGVRGAGGPWLSGTVSWSSDARQLTFRPSTTLGVGTVYEVHVNSTATDHSDPGNAFAGPYTWTFSTGSVADKTPPSILAVAADPPVQIANGFVNLTADVTDNIGIGTMSAAVKGPSFDQNLTMALASGTRWYVNRTYPAVGHYNVTIWATDSSGNVASRTGGMDISPAGTAALPSPASVAASVTDGLVDVTWSPVAAPNLSGYYVYRGNASLGPFDRLTASPLPISGPTVYHDSTAQSGHTYYYTVTAVNSTGAESPHGPVSAATIPPYQTPPLFDPVPWAVAGVTLGVILGALYGMVWRRRPA
jgi:hypothetical protein